MFGVDGSDRELITADECELFETFANAVAFCQMIEDRAIQMACNQ